MGAKQSAAAKDKNAGTNDATSAPAPLLKFGVILQGVSGSGVSAVQTAAALPDGRVLRVDDQFLTSPPIYSLEWNSPNHPGYGFGIGENAKTDNSVWEYGGRSEQHEAAAVAAASGTSSQSRRMTLTRCMLLFCFLLDCAAVAPRPSGRWLPI